MTDVQGAGRTVAGEHAKVLRLSQKTRAQRGRAALRFFVRARTGIELDLAHAACGAEGAGGERRGEDQNQRLEAQAELLTGERRAVGGSAVGGSAVDR